jgi:DtxR family Mn-dependent transcriptional regulator
MPTQTEENYIKAIFKITEKNQGIANTNAIAEQLSTSPASVTDMLQRLSEKEYFNYEKYKGVNLTAKGIKMATNLIRKHRLWESFLVDKLGFSWDEVHDIAEELEHVNSEELVNRLDKFLGYPKYDPHGDPIPNAEGKFTLRNQVPLVNLNKNESGIVVGVRVHDTPFLLFLNSINVKVGSKIFVNNHIDFDHSKEVIIDDKNKLILSHKLCSNLFVKKL